MTEKGESCDAPTTSIVANKDHVSFVEFETAADLKTAVEKLDNQDFKGANVHCTADVCLSTPKLRLYDY